MYKHNICKYGPNCFYYEFSKDGTFQWRYFQDLIGQGIVSGTWNKIKDTITLKPEFPFREKVSRITESPSASSNPTISVVLLRPEGDSLKANWLVKVNNGKEYEETDSLGCLKIANRKIELVTIADYFEKILHIPIFKIIDSVFEIKNKPNTDYTIFVAEKNSSEVTDWMTKKFIIKGRKLIPLTYEPEMAFLGQRRTYYKKVSR
jgi:hypothetical protein